VSLGLTRMRPIPALALGLTLAILAALVLPFQTTAQARRAGCSPAVTHVKRGHRTCRRPAHKLKVRRHHAPAGHRAAPHGSGTHATTGPTPAALAGTTVPICEDGAFAIYAPGGSVSCADGSEPQCSDGSSLTLSSDGSRQVCPVLSAGADSGATAPTCEDGAAPVRAANGAYSCLDGSEPACQDGSSPTPESDGTLLCAAATSDNSGA